MIRLNLYVVLTIILGIFNFIMLLILIKVVIVLCRTFHVESLHFPSLVESENIDNVMKEIIDDNQDFDENF